MALLQLKSNEVVKIIKSNLPDEIKKLKGTDTGFTFEIIVDHNIPLIPNTIPLEMEYNSYDKTNLIFELSVNSENRLIRKAAGKIIKLLSSQLGNMLPEGIAMQQHYIYVDISEQFAETGLRPKIVQAQFEDKTFHLEFKV
jgi:hypothetical protein